MGHKGVQVFFTHYRALTAPGDGAAFFSITPDSVKKELRGTLGVFRQVAGHRLTVGVQLACLRG